ncbi:hypothetical protein CCHOA_00625 [Corynebacterium choanae]|uniref:Uncharacterized protein n=1 Tax=Corynebacterium choanae TaxID=1862358 RepID=A0A3G6J956_9CORY|nr:hypothetical protein CCHOA_00625 [Corynebacterium choanae]
MAGFFCSVRILLATYDIIHHTAAEGYYFAHWVVAVLPTLLLVGWSAAGGQAACQVAPLMLLAH